ncbi:MAG: tRNA (adenosine(37)-N6)-threonylcarbamoyltransferase complex dimerization subunit type 1 TsaB [Salinivirgaceae bacterium]
MAILLNIETATPVCSVSLSKDGQLIDRRESFDDRSHASLLTVFINELFEAQQLQASQLDAISISEGPGSYTGLRIGVSVAKGICYAAGKPLVAVNTLKAMALMAKEQLSDSNVLLCPQIDARRMEVYAAFYDMQLNCIRPTQADIVDENSYLEFLNKQAVAFFGNGADKCRNLITHPNARFIEGVYPSASYTAILAEELFQEKAFKDVAYFEPFYLKDFVATLPKRKIF